MNFTFTLKDLQVIEEEFYNNFSGKFPTFPITGDNNLTTYERDYWEVTLTSYITSIVQDFDSYLLTELKPSVFILNSTPTLVFDIHWSKV